MAEQRGPPRVKNKAAAPEQITAEMLMQEAASHQEHRIDAPNAKAHDLEEVHEFRQRKRTEYENAIRRSPHLLKNWTQYADFEIAQAEWARGRSIYERALDNGHHASVPLWTRYIDAELKGRNISHARNLCDRMVTLMPRVDKGWYKYVYIEQVLGDAERTREVFRRWLSFQPDEQAYLTAIKFEEKHDEFEQAREVWSALLQRYPGPQQYIRRARWEENHGDEASTRECWEQSAESIEWEEASEDFIIAWARWEDRVEETERARSLMRSGLDTLPRSKTSKLQAAYTRFQKQHGSTADVEEVVLAKRRAYYQQVLKDKPKDVDTWIELCRLEESTGDHERIKDTYEQAVAKALPPSQQKRHWRRYIYLGLFYSIWCESTLGDITSTREILRMLIDLIPHKSFTFAKVWIHFAQFEIRQMDRAAAWKLLGRSIGECPKPKLFREYVALSLKFHDYKRARQVYEKFVLHDSSLSGAWVEWAKMEYKYLQFTRARGILDVGRDEKELDTPESVWKASIDLEVSEGEYDRARTLYEALLEKADHVKLFISYAQFEINADPDIDSDNEDDDEQASPAAISRARAIFQRGYNVFKDKGAVDDRVQLLNAWKSFEASQGDVETREKVAKMMPSRVKKRRKLDEGEFEEYLTWVFPGDEEVNPKALEMMRKAQEWKMKKAAQAAGGVTGGTVNGDD